MDLHSVVILASSSLPSSLAPWIAISKVFGSEELYVAICVAIYTLIDPELGSLVISSILLAVSSNVFLKTLLKLPRPPKSLWKVVARGPGFPSGHSEVCASFWTSISFGKKSLVLAVAGGVITALVATSRVVLGVHYVSDVVGGALIGLVMGLIPYALSKVVSIEKSVGVCCASSLALAIASIPLSTPYPWLRSISLVSAGIAAGFSSYTLLGKEITKAFRVWGWRIRIANFVACLVVSGGFVIATRILSGLELPLGFGAGISLVLIPLAIDRARKRFSR